MSDVDFDTGLEDKLDCDCNLEEDCCDDGCLFRFKFGPCEAYNKSSGELDMSLMCSAKTANAHTPNFIRPIREKTRRISCRRQRLRGLPDCNFDIDFDLCHGDPVMKYLLSDCPIAVCMVPRSDLYDSTLSASQQSIAVIRGLFIGSDWSWNNEFDECQTTSRNFSCTGVVLGLKQWLDALPDPASIAQRINNSDFELENAA